jgi:DNA repair protein RecO (recombination protein O)
MKYKKLTGIILKKQNYREADQIVSIWTREAGKVRFLAKSLRKASSKLNYAIQDLSEVEINLAGNHLPTLIGVKPRRQFSNLHEDLKKTAIAFYSAELMLKMTADEHPNLVAYELFADFLNCLNQLDYSVRYYPVLECFSLKLLDALGFSIEHAHTSFHIPKHLTSGLVRLNSLDFEEFDGVRMESDQVEQLHSLINRFIEYILERNIKSELFLVSISL